MSFPYNADFIEDVIARLGKIPADAKPQWGKLKRAGLIVHLNNSLFYSMGRLEPVPSKSNIALRRIVKPLVLYRALPIPKNIQVQMPAAPGRGDTGDDLQLLSERMNEFLEGMDTGGFKTNDHPAFGPLTAHEWGRMHVAHIGHHLKQFNA